MSLVVDQQRGLCIQRENTLLTSSVSRRGISIEPDITVACRLINLLADQACGHSGALSFYKLPVEWLIVYGRPIPIKIMFAHFILKCCSTGKLIWLMDFKNSNLILRGLYEF